MAGEGRMCVPGMLLHHVKGVNVVVEGDKTIEEESEEIKETTSDSEERVEVSLIAL